MSKIFYFFITIVFLAFGLVLGVFNPHLVKIDLVFQQAQFPLSNIIALSMLLGILLTATYMGSIILKLRWNLKRQLKINTKQTNKTIELNSQLIELKNNVSSSKEITSNV